MRRRRDRWKGRGVTRHRLKIVGSITAWSVLWVGGWLAARLLMHWGAQ